MEEIRVEFEICMKCAKIKNWLHFCLFSYSNLCYNNNRVEKIYDHKNDVEKNYVERMTLKKL